MTRVTDITLARTRLGWQPTVRIEAVQALLVALKVARVPEEMSANTVARCVAAAWRPHATP